MTLAEAQDQVLSYVRGHVAEPRKAPLCGNSIATDRSFIARDMPALDAYLHYRMVDVSSVKELARRWYPRVYFASPPKHGGHRALADIKESIKELRYYREAIFVRPPGPDSATAREIAGRHGEPAPGLPSEPGAAGQLVKKVVAAVQRLRELDMAKPPGVAETIDWVRTLGVLGEADLTPDAASDTLGAVVKDRDDLDLARENLAEIVAGA